MVSRPSEDIIDTAQRAYEQSLPRTKIKITKTSNGGHSLTNCVAYIKTYLGIGGTWGNGGRLLSLNSSPVVNAVVIFRYTHVAVVQEVLNDQILIREANYVHGQVSLRWLSITDPTIKGYHLF